MYKDVSSFTSHPFGISLACEPFLICLPMKSRLRFVILPFFTLCRIHCLSMSETECDECCLNKFLWMWSVHGKKEERSNIINHCVCIQMSGYWLIIFNFVIIRSLITQWFFFASLEDGKVLNEMESKCDFS